MSFQKWHKALKESARTSHELARMIEARQGAIVKAEREIRALKALRTAALEKESPAAPTVAELFERGKQIALRQLRPAK
jgi:hypothetical protein